MPIESPYATSYDCVNNSNLPPILHRFPDMAENWSNFRRILAD